MEKKQKEPAKKKEQEHKYGVYHSPDYKPGKKMPKKKTISD